ncbi:MAG: hypothetical protein E7199_03565 [Schwartzia succinivorans]|nr:hypothetical protein [Schwartzia succinivorans]
MWTEGIIDGYEFKVKKFPEASSFGINGGRISKLWIAKDGMEAACYERGWLTKPTTKDAKAVYNKLVKQYN